MPRSQDSSTLNQAHDEDDDRDDQEDVQQATEGIRRNHSEEPKDEKNCDEGPKHWGSPICEDSGIEGKERIRQLVRARTMPTEMTPPDPCEASEFNGSCS